MIWEVVTNSKDVSGGLDIILLPENDVVRFVILQYNLKDLSRLISKAAMQMTTGIEHVHIMNYAEMDWEDKAWAKSVKGSEIESGEMFLVHDVMGKTIIKEQLFDKILFDYGSKVLEVYQSDISLPVTWKDEITIALEKLKSKIDKTSTA